MEKTKKIAIIISIVVSVLALVLGLFLVGFSIYRKARLEEIERENLIHSELQNELINNYENISSIDIDYTIEKALECDDFVISNKNEIYNTERLETFITGISNSGDALLRVTSETTDSLLSVLEIKSLGNEILVTQNNTQISGDIIENKYLKSDGYTLNNEVITLVDGTNSKSYYLAKNGSEEKIDLFAYVIDNEIQYSGDIEESNGDIKEQSGDFTKDNGDLT